MKLAVVIALITCAAIPSASALQCYQCASTKSWGDCSTTAVTCQSSVSRCAKLEVTAKGGSQSGTAYAKGCANTCDTKDVPQCHATIAGVSISCKLNCCSGNLCNTGAAPMVSVVAMIACAFFAFLGMH